MLEEGFISAADLARSPRRSAGGRASAAPGRGRLPTSPRRCASTSSRPMATTASTTTDCRSRTTLDSAVQAAAESALRYGLLRLDHRRGWRGALLRGQRLDLEGEAIEALPAAIRSPARGSQGWCWKPASGRHSSGHRKGRSTVSRRGSPGRRSARRPRFCASATSPGFVWPRIRRNRRSPTGFSSRSRRSRAP